MIDDEDQAGDEFAVQDDFDVGDDMVADGGGKPSFKEAWQSNPLLKVGAAVFVAAIAVAAYTTVTKPNPIDETKSLVRGVDAASVATVVGKGTHDKEYTEAIEAKNKARAKEARETGKSAIPTPVSTAQDQGLPIPQQTKTTVDPLKEWKDSVQARKIKQNNVNPLDDDAMQPPPKAELVPLVQPITPKPEARLDPKATQGLAQQMRAMLNKQKPNKPRTMKVTRRDNLWTITERAKAEAEKEAAAAAKALGGTGGVTSSPGLRGSAPQAQLASAATQATPQVIIPAGDIFYAQLLLDLNSDIPIPVLATVLSGPFTGGKAIGSMAKQDDYLVITYNRIIKDDVSYAFNGIALDEATALPALQTDIDHHYFDRLVLPAAAKFVSGYSSALAQTGTTTTTTSGGGVATSQPKPDAKESLYKGVEGAAQEIANIIVEDRKTEPTVYVARGTTMGVLVLDTITTANAGGP